MKKNKLFTFQTLALIPIGIAINFGGAKLALHFSLPLFLDSIGTFLAAIIGGILPGILVGFLSNAINSISDSITLYYGIISVLLGISAAIMSAHGWFHSFEKTLLSILIFAFIGGGLGSILTFLLYGYNFGTGISAPLAHEIFESTHFNIFFSQLTADILIDLLDKTISVCLTMLILFLLPQRLLEFTPLGKYYMKNRNKTDNLIVNESFDSPIKNRVISIRIKIVAMIIAIAVINALIATVISSMVLKNTLERRYAEYGNTAANLAASVIDPDKVNQYLDEGVETDSYKETENRLISLKSKMPIVKFIYVYQIREDGCHIVFDLDTPDVPGGKLGETIPFESDFQEYIPSLLQGREIPPVISNGVYGYLLTVYHPIIDSNNETVAYAAIDVDMETVLKERKISIIRMISILFGATFIGIVIAIWYS